MMVPHYMTTNARPGSTLIIDENNNPVYQGMIEVPFTVFIPRTCADGSRPGPCPIVNYGHGMLGSRAEVRHGLRQRERRRTMSWNAAHWLWLTRVRNLGCGAARPGWLRRAVGCGQRGGLHHGHRYGTSALRPAVHRVLMDVSGGRCLRARAAVDM